MGTVSMKGPLPAPLAETVRKAGLGLIIVSVLPIMIALIVLRQGTSSKEPYIGFVFGAAFAGLGGLVLARKWPALYVAAVLCAAGALGMGTASLREGTPAGLLLAVGLASAAAFMFKVGTDLRKHVAGSR